MYVEGGTWTIFIDKNIIKTCMDSLVQARQQPTSNHPKQPRNIHSNDLVTIQKTLVNA